MKTIWRNLLSVLRRFRVASALNIIGLSVAFAAFLLLMMQVRYDREFDRGIPEADHVFRVDVAHGSDYGAVINRPLADAFIQFSPHIVAGALRQSWNTESLVYTEEGGNRRNFVESWCAVYPEYTKVFSFQMVEGSVNGLEEPASVLIPRSVATKMFGDQPAVGKQIWVKDSYLGERFTIKGVFEDFPENSSVDNFLYFRIPPTENAQTFNNWSYNFYVKLDDPSLAEGLVQDFMTHFDISTLRADASWSHQTLGLHPITELHFMTNIDFDLLPKMSKSTLIVLFAISILIVLIAGINFMNFSTAISPMRLRSINTQKVLGGTDVEIRLALLGESVLISLFAYLLGLLWVYLAQGSVLTSLIDANISLSAQPGLVALTFVIALLTGIGAGLYPAYYVTSFPPALVLKGNFGLSPKGRLLRDGLVWLQFVASFGLIIGASFMYLQNRHMRNEPLGYDKDALIVTNLDENIRKEQGTFVNQLKSYSGIEGVSFSDFLFSSSDVYRSWGRSYQGKDIEFQNLFVDPSFLRTLGISVVDGRDFREDDVLKRNSSLIFNERARYQYGLELGGLIDSMEIVGFIPDVKFTSLRKEVSPMAFIVMGEKHHEKGWTEANYAYIKVKAGSDLYGALDHVRQTLRELSPDMSFDVRLFDEVLNNLYEKETQLSLLVTLFGLLVILISIVGVFGLVIFDSEYRRKEIGIRKVMGATTGEILIMFNKGYVKILLASFVIGAPIAGYMVYRWLENFAYKTPMYPWVYLLALAVVGLVTLCTVTYQNWRVANANPLDSVKSE